MMRRTHAAMGLALGFGLAGHFHQPIVSAALYGLLTQGAAVLPDIDLKLHIKHRTVTHSLFALLLISLGAQYAAPLLTPYVSIGYGSHLLLDFLTVWGIPLLWPWSRRFRLMRISTGGRIDSLLCAVALCATLSGLLSALKVST
jgi:inner membrane protein